MLDVYRRALRFRMFGTFPLVTGGALLLYAGSLAFLEAPISSLYLLVFVYTLVVSLGLVGNDVRSGTIHLVLARPVSRNQYLAGSYLGALTAILSFALLLILVVISTTGLHGSGLAGDLTRTPTAAFVSTGLHGRGPAAVDVVRTVTSATVVAVWELSLVFFFSTFLPGQMDVLAYLGLLLVTISLRSASALMGVRAQADWLASQVLPSTPQVSLSAWPDLVILASNAAVVLLAGTLIFNRREFSYEAG